MGNGGGGGILKLNPPKMIFDMIFYPKYFDGGYGIYT